MLRKSGPQREADLRLSEAVHALGYLCCRFQSSPKDDAFCQRMLKELPRITQTLEKLVMRSFIATSNNLN